MLSFQSFVIKTLDELSKKKDDLNDGTIIIDFSQSDLVTILSTSTENSEKNFLDGFWIRKRDGRKCCENDDCYNITEKRNVKCRKCLGKVKRAICLHLDCSVRPSYGNPGEMPVYCVSHKSPTMVNVVSKKCEFSTCFKQPRFGENVNKPTHCADHKTESMTRNRCRKCMFPNCNKQSSFGIEGQHPICCADHKSSQMIDIANIIRRCRYDDCIKMSSYGEPGSRATCCFGHKTETMVNLIGKRCKFLGCLKRPSFGEPGTKPTCCSEHKDPTMISLVNHIKCNFLGCLKRSNFGEPGTKPSRCREHKDPTMIPIARKSCQALGCHKNPSYGLPGYKVSHCVEHKLINMIDLTHSMCQYIDCHTRASFNFPGNKSLYCFSHKQKGMIKNPTARCKTKPCKELALFGLLKPEHCEMHKEPLEINFVEKECVSCGLSNILGLDGRCEFCNPQNIRNTYLSKQKIVEDFLRANNCIFSSDQTIDRGECGRERPDILFFAGLHAVIIEIDENQHSDRLCECEQTRMINIWQGLAMPVWFLRYNPDVYKKSSDQKRCEHESRGKRLFKLKEWLDYALVHNPIEFGNAVNVMYLYYDGYQDSDSFQCLQKLEDDSIIVTFE